MKKYMMVLFIFLLIGCDQVKENNRMQAERDKADSDRKMAIVESCVKLGGIPIINDHDRLTDCKFPPNKN